MAERTDIKALQFILDKKQCMPLLEALPDYRSMVWVSPSIFPFDAPAALIMSNSSDHQIVASLQRGQSGSWEAKVLLRSGSGPWIHSHLGDLANQRLVQPFNMIRGDRRKLSILIRYYFAKKGAIKDMAVRNLKDFSEVMVSTLRLIFRDTQLLAEKAQVEPGETGDKEVEAEAQNAEDVVEEMEEDGHVGGRRKRRQRKQSTPEPRESDYEKVTEYLRESNALHLLSNIPSHETMIFQLHGQDSNGYKLMIGARISDRKSIWAYILPRVKRFYDVSLRAEDRRASRAPEEIAFEDVLSQVALVPPFESAIHSESEFDRSDKARLTVLIKWYFIASDWHTNIVVRETGFPHRFLSVLEFIAEKNGYQRSRSLAKGRKKSSTSMEDEQEEQQEPEWMHDDDVSEDDVSQQVLHEERERAQLQYDEPSTAPTAEPTSPAFTTHKTRNRRTHLKEPTHSPQPPESLTHQMAPLSVDTPTASKRNAEQVWFDEEQDMLNTHRRHCARFNEIQEKMEQLKLELDAVASLCKSSYEELLQHREEKPVLKKPKWMSAWDMPED